MLQMRIHSKRRRIRFVAVQGSADLWRGWTCHTMTYHQCHLSLHSPNWQVSCHVIMCCSLSWCPLSWKITARFIYVYFLFLFTSANYIWHEMQFSKIQEIWQPSFLLRDAYEWDTVEAKDHVRVLGVTFSDYAVARYLSIRLSHASIVPKHLYISSKIFHHRVDPPF